MFSTRRYFTSVSLILVLNSDGADFKVRMLSQCCLTVSGLLIIS